MPTAKSDLLPILVLKLRDAKNTAKKCEELIKGDLQPRVISALKDLGVKTLVADGEGVEVTATLVESVATSVDWEQLHSRLTKEQWDAIQIATPSNTLLKDAMASGAIGEALVAECIIESPKSPYVRISERTVASVLPDKPKPRAVGGKRKPTAAGKSLQSKKGPT